MKLKFDIGTGRISEIINYLKQRKEVESVSDISPRIKLVALCQSLQITCRQFDRLLSENSPVLRTIKGHAFEAVFDEIVEHNNHIVEEIGGDTNIDRIVNRHTLQLKTPNASGTKDFVVEYKTHKTHGAKSEKEGMSYYHLIEKFPDFLVGLISYEPLQIIFLERKILIPHPKDSNYIKSPFKISWENHDGLNAFHKIGITDFKNDPSVYTAAPKELLPKSAKLLGLNTEIILNTILRESNFRIWDMSIRGFAKEMAFKIFLDRFDIKYLPPENSQRSDARANKSDLVLINKAAKKMEFLQIKGLSLNNCKFSGKQAIVSVETQLTRGRVNDDPTHSRLYYFTDFDWLIVGLEPCLAKKFRKECGLFPQSNWEFYSVPTQNLKSHSQMKHRINSIQKFTYLEFQKYKISDQWIKQWQKIN